MKQKRVRTLSLLVIFPLFFSLIANNTLAMYPIPPQDSADNENIEAAKIVTALASFSFFLAALGALRVSALCLSESNLFSRCRTSPSDPESGPLVVNEASNQRDIKKALAGCSLGIGALAMLVVIPYWVISIFRL